MSIRPMKDLCFRVVMTEIWSHSDIPEALTELCVKSAELHKIYMSEYVQQKINAMKPFYYSKLEPTLKKIMDLQILPHKLKVKLALALISLEKEVIDFSLSLELRERENIFYCIKKVVIQIDCKLDRTLTILKILFDSYLEVNVIGHDIVKCCALRPFMLENILEDFVVCNKREKKLKIYQMINILRESNIFKVWKLEASLARDGNYEFKANNVQALEYVAANAPLEVLRYYHMRLKKKYRQLLLPSVAVFAILSTKDTEDNIVFFYQKLPSQIWLKIMIRYHEKIFKKLFLGYYSDYCYNFYKLLCKSCKVEICKNILFKSLELLCSTAAYRYEYENIVFSNSKNTFLLMWYYTPDSIKEDMGIKFFEMLDLLIKNDDFHLLSILMADKAFNEKQKFDYALHIVSRLLMGSNDKKLDKFIKQSSSAHIFDIKKNFNINVVKQMILKKSDFLCEYEALTVFFDCKSLEKTLKCRLIDDKTFIIEALITISQHDKGEENVGKFLKWIFDNDETEMDNFVQKHLIDDLWLVDIYKRYLLECSNEYYYPTPFLFTCLKVNHETAANIKALVRSDTKLMLQMCDNFMSPRLHKGYKLFDCIFSKNDAKEIKKFQHNYLLSDRGISQLYKLFESDFLNEDLYLAYGFYDKVKHYFKIEKHWMEDDYTFQEKINEKLMKHGHPNSLKSISDFDKRIPLLPSEKVEINRVIVDANYRMFCCIVYDHYSKYDVLTEIEKGITRTLTGYTEYYAMRYITEVPFVP